MTLRRLMSQHARVHTDDLSANQGAVELVVDGMTCASCAARIEKKLNRMPGVRGQRQLRHGEGARRAAGGHHCGRRDRRRRGDRVHRRAASTAPANETEDAGAR